MAIYLIDQRHYGGRNCFDSREAAEALCKLWGIDPKWITEAWMVNLATVQTWDGLN